jgi:hypothetical protein
MWASPDGNDLSGWEFYELFPGVDATPCGGAPDPTVTCSTTISAAPERIWMTDVLADGYISGVPTITMSMAGDTGDRWATQACYIKVFLVRSGVDIASFQTDWSPSNGGIGGADVTMTGTASVLLRIVASDRLRFELYGRKALHGGYSDNHVNQAVGYGYLGGGTYLAIARLGGLVQKLFP